MKEVRGKREIIRDEISSIVIVSPSRRSIRAKKED
jgi:hypothetical protein